MEKFIHFISNCKPTNNHTNGKNKWDFIWNTDESYSVLVFKQIGAKNISHTVRKIAGNLQGIINGNETVVQSEIVFCMDEF